MIKKWIKKWLSLSCLCCFSCLLFAEEKPLRIAVPAFSPPFVMQSASKQFYGFDIKVIEYVCKKMNRKCEYVPMAFEALLPSLLEEKADIAIGGLIMTYKRSRVITFSIPYLMSEGQFIARENINIAPPFQLSQLSDQRIGILDDSAFRQMTRFINLQKPTLIQFKQDTDIIHALNVDQITLALLSLPKARYWKSNSAGLFKSLGKPFPVGFGFAIAVSPANAALIRDINLALLDYQDSEIFKTNYNMYIKDELN